MWWLSDVQTTNRLFWIQSRKHFYPAPLSFFKNNIIQKWTLVSLKLLIWCLSSISGQNKLILLLWFAIRNFQHNDQDDDSGEWWHYLQVLLKYTEYNEPHESLTNKNIIDVSNIPSIIGMRIGWKGQHRLATIKSGSVKEIWKNINWNQPIGFMLAFTKCTKLTLKRGNCKKVKNEKKMMGSEVMWGLWEHNRSK